MKNSIETYQLVFYKEEIDSRFDIFLTLITCWEINRVTSKCQKDFLDNTFRKDLKQRKRTSPSNFTYSN